MSLLGPKQPPSSASRQLELEPRIERELRKINEFVLRLLNKYMNLYVLVKKQTNDILTF